MKKPLIVVTGAAAGIGKATAGSFSELGYPLLLIDKNFEKDGNNSSKMIFYKKADVTDREAFAEALLKAEVQFGQADCLINNAGVMMLESTYTQDPEKWQSMINVNIMGLLNGIHTVLPQMIKRKGGTIINLGSIAGRKSLLNHAVYCGTKFAVHAISESLREEVALHNVRVITIAPGGVETELLKDTSSKSIQSEFEKQSQNIGGILSPNDVARAILFAYQQPQSICVRELVLAVTKQQ